MLYMLIIQQQLYNGRKMYQRMVKLAQHVNPCTTDVLYTTNPKECFGDAIMIGPQTFMYMYEYKHLVWQQHVHAAALTSIE